MPTSSLISSSITRATYSHTRRSRNTSASISCPLLATWGKNDPFFIPAGAEAYRQDIPAAELVFYDTGHFALETHVEEISNQIRSFLTGLVERGKF